MAGIEIERDTYYVHLPQDGSALSHCFFFRLQFRQTLDDLGVVLCCAGDVASDEAVDIGTIA
jgi:hypothetical protein